MVMYPREQLMVEKSGLQTSRKWGLIRPTDTLAMSVNDWLTAQPNRNTPICKMTRGEGQTYTERIVVQQNTKIKHSRSTDKNKTEESIKFF